MLKLNLAYPERSDIKYEIINFPDGHKHLKLESCPLDTRENIKIISRFKNYDDLFLISQATLILKLNQNDNISLKIPYFLTARCDRFFSLIESKDLFITMSFVNTLKFDEVIVYDIHNLKETRGGICSLNNKNIDWNNYYIKDSLIAYPDEGAYMRYRDISQGIYGIKERKGRDILEYTGLHKVMLENLEGKTICVRDDLIDGGLTFIKFAELLKQHGAGDLYLYATHGIFSKGYDELLKYYKHIWCTNSFKDIEHPDITCIDVYN